MVNKYNKRAQGKDRTEPYSMANYGKVLGEQMNATGFWAIARKQPERLALVNADESTLTFGELDARANQLSNALRSMGLSFRDHFAVLLHNDSAWIECFLAANQVGLYMTPINYHLTGPEVGYILDNCEAKVFIAHARYAEAAVKAVKEVGFDPSRCFSIGGDIPGFTPYESLLAKHTAEPPTDRKAGTLMLYTSGTTGRPKGVKRSLMEGNPDIVASMAGMLGSLFKLKAGEGVHLVTGPLYHAAPGGFGTASLHLGHTLVLMDKWDAEDTLRLIDKYKVTVSHMVPTMFERLVNLPNEVKKKYAVSSLECIIHGAAPINPETKKRMINWWRPVLYEYYGATEGGGTIASSEDWLKKPGTCGKPWPGCNIKIFDDNGVALPANQPGNVYMSSFIGGFEYHKDPDKTKESFLGDMFTVGDVGYLDSEGWLFLCDRAKDLIIAGGVNIYPAEIEKVMIEHPKVEDVAVFGIPNDEWGEEVKAVVQLRPDVPESDALRQELMAFCKERLAKFKLPRSIDFIAELPRLDTGKLYKRFLRDKYWEGRSRKI